jgi:hypothetical protein
VDSVPDPLLLRKSSGAGNRTRDPWVCSQRLITEAVVIKDPETLIYASKVGLEINLDETKYMLLSCHQNALQNRDIKIRKSRFKVCHSSNIWERR